MKEILIPAIKARLQSSAGKPTNRVEPFSRIAKRSAAVIITAMLTAACTVGCTFSGAVQESLPTETTAFATDAPTIAPDSSQQNTPTALKDSQQTDPFLVPSKGIPEGSEDIFTLTLGSWQPEEPSDTQAPYMLQVLPEEPAEFEQSDVITCGVRVAIRDGSPQDAYLRVELHEAAYINPRQSKVTFLAAVEQPLTPDTKSFSAMFRLDTAQLNRWEREKYTYTYRVFLCDGDGNVLAGKESAENTVKTTFTPPLLGLDNYPLREITRNVDETLLCYSPYATNGVAAYVSISDPSVVEAQVIEGQTYSVFELHTLRAGRATITFTMNNIESSLTIYVDENAPTIAVQRYPGVAPLEWAKGGLWAVKDASGTDITGDVYDLWLACNEIYNQGSLLMFPENELTTLYSQAPNYYRLGNYAQIVDSIFTADGRKQLEQAKTGGQPLFEEQDGSYYRMCPWKDYTQKLPILCNLQTKQTGNGRMTFSMGYRFYTDPEIDGSSVPSFEYVDFTIVKVDGVWMIDEYCHPGFSY